MTYRSKASIGEEGMKFDDDKLQIYQGFTSYFPQAISSVTKLSQFGAKKYAWGNWRHLDDAYHRYSDAMMRHHLLEDEVIDKESGLLHITAVAWNAMARLELFLTAEDKKDDKD